MQLVSARGAQKRRDESKKLSMYSKQWSPGDTLRVFYPIFFQDGRPEIAVGAVWGHNVSDIKGLGLKTAFIPSTTDFDENALPIGQPDITYQFSQIARVFVNGQKAVEEAAVLNKNWPSESARKEALKTIEEKFDAKNNMKAIRPIIGKAQYYISTEVVSIKIVNGVPNTETIAVTSEPLSNQKIAKLYALMDDPKYAPQEGDEFFEVEWKYTASAEKAESARGATAVGLTPEYRLQTQFADAYKHVSGFFNQVARDPVSIQRRATRAIDPARVRQALTQYSFLNSGYLDAAVEEDVAVLTKHADLIKELEVVKTMANEELIAKINEAIAAMAVSRPTVAPEIPTPVMSTVTQEVPTMASETSTPVAMPVATPAPEVSAPVAADPVASTPQIPNLGTVTGAPNIQQLLNNPNNAGLAGEDSLEDVDFSTMV